MKYLCLAYGDTTKWDALSQGEKDAMMNECSYYDETLRGSGHLIVMEGLQLGRAAAAVRLRNGRVVTIDGPRAATTGHLGGFYLIDARDLNEAIRVASNTAAARLAQRLGWDVEVQPVPGHEGL